MSARNSDLGTVLTAAALGRVKRVADATPDPEFTGYDSEEEFLAKLGDHWVQQACAVQQVTKDPQWTQQVLTDALNRAARKVRRESR